MTAQPPRVLLPRLTQSRVALTHPVDVINERGETEHIFIPAERPLTVYVDKRELVTLMTLGADPELLVLGYLRNQRFIVSPQEVESITVDWDVGAAAVRTHQGIDRIEERTARKVVTTGCGQGSVYGDLMQDVDGIQLPPTTLTQGGLYGLLNTMRLQESTYKQAGSVHGCALFRDEQLAYIVEDVGRHNAVDTLAGWMWMHRASRDESSDGTVFYTTGRLTSEMVIKAAQMGVAVLISRSGITQMGLAVAQQLGVCAIGRATNRRFLCYSGHARLIMQPELAQHRLRSVA